MENRRCNLDVTEVQLDRPLVTPEAARGSSTSIEVPRRVKQGGGSIETMLKKVLILSVLVALGAVAAKRLKAK